MEKNDKEELKTLGISVLIGLLVGAVVGLFRFGIEQTSDFWLHIFSMAHQNPIWFILIIVGFLITGVVAGYFVKQYPHVGGSGIPEVKLQMQGKLHLQWWPILWRKLIGGVMVIGSGLFLGPEGPSLQLGSSIGQGVAEGLKKDKTDTRIFLATGAASGLAAAFGAPLSGALFVLEEVFHNFSPKIWMNALIGAICSDFVVAYIFGQKPSLAMTYNSMFPIPDYWHLIILGIILGLLGHLYKKGLFGFKKVYAKITFLPKWLLGLIPLAILIPIMYYLPLITGPGNRLILSLPGMIPTSTWSLVGILAVYYLIRLAFSIVSYDSGLPSGIFLPILTMGALIGATYGLLMVHLGLLPRNLVVNLVIFSMAGYFAAIIRAPFTAIVLLAEMVGSLLHLMPLALVAFVALLVDKLMGGRPIYGMLARAMDNTEEDAAENYSGQEDSLVLPVYESSKLVDKRISEIKWPKRTLVKTIYRDGHDIIPDGETVIRAGDELILEIDQGMRGQVYNQMKKLQGVELDG